MGIIIWHYGELVLHVWHCVGELKHLIPSCMMELWLSGWMWQMLILHFKKNQNVLCLLWCNEAFFQPSLASKFFYYKYIKNNGQEKNVITSSSQWESQCALSDVYNLDYYSCTIKTRSLVLLTNSEGSHVGLPASVSAVPNLVGFPRHTVRSHHWHLAQVRSDLVQDPRSQ